MGSHESLDVDVRVIAATHRKLEERIASGEFREDLYYRLNVVKLYIPTLAERREDIPLLANHFLSRLAERYRRGPPGASRRRRCSCWCRRPGRATCASSST